MKVERKRFAHPSGLCWEFFDVESKMIDTDYGPELQVTVRTISGDYIWGSQEAMGVDGQLAIWRQYRQAVFDAETDPRIKAVRADKLVGVGTCTGVDEAMDDLELMDYLDEVEAKTPEQAVKAARDLEGMHREQATNQRWGEDDDPQLRDLAEWEEARREDEA